MEELVKQVGVEYQMLPILAIHQFVLCPSFSLFLKHLKGVLNVRLQDGMIHR